VSLIVTFALMVGFGKQKVLRQQSTDYVDN